MKPLALVVENDASTRKLLDALLSRSGFEVDLAPTVSDALILLRSVAYDIVFCDLLLPGANGFDILEWIGDHQPALLSRTLVVSGAAEPFLQRVRNEWPRVRVIRKPFELGELLDAARYLTAARSEHAPSAMETFTRQSLRAGAKAGVIIRVNGSIGEPVFAYGYEPGVFESFFPLDLDAPFPLCAAIRHERPVWIASLIAAAADYPILAPVWAKHESRALGAVPLMRGGVVIGAAGWSFREPRLFSEPEQQAFLGIADEIAESLADEHHSTASSPGNDQSASIAGA